MIIAVIPARGGSKRIPRKNIRDFCGKPMIAYSIEAALEAKLFDRILVSTDDEEIAEIARQAGAETPFLRPKELSDDVTGTVPVIRHAMEWVEANDGPVDYVCCLYATAPFVDGGTLKRGFEEMRAAGTDFALAVTSFPFPIQRALRIRTSGLLEPISPDAIKQRSQDLEEAWHDAGQFFWSKPAALSEDIADLLGRATPIRIPRHLVQDIDTEEDWTRAEFMLRSIRES